MNNDVYAWALSGNVKKVIDFQQSLYSFVFLGRQQTKIFPGGPTFVSN